MMVGVNVLAALRRCERSQSWLSSKMGMNPSSLSKRVRGNIPFDIEELAAIAEILAVSIASLVELPVDERASGSDEASLSNHLGGFDFKISVEPRTLVS